MGCGCLYRSFLNRAKGCARNDGGVVMENLMAGVGRKFVNTALGGITPDELMDVPFGVKKFNLVLDKELLGRSCPCCGSPNLNKDGFNYVCFRCGITIPMGDGRC